MAPRFDSAPASPDSFSQPRPRPPRSPGHSAQIRVQNRRRAYLERHPGYFQSSEHELADPLLYDTLIRRFQTPAEREAEGRAKGYARVLEGSLLRGEERLAMLRRRDGGPVGLDTVGLDPAVVAAAERGGLEGEGRGRGAAGSGVGGAVVGGAGSSGSGGGGRGSGSNDGVAEETTTGFSGLTVELTPPPPTTREQGRAQWEGFLRDRFVRGEDEDFEYGRLVDGEDEYDVLEREEREEAWFGEEDPEWVSDGGGGGGNGGDERGGGGRRRLEMVLQGETGVQDF